MNLNGDLLATLAIKEPLVHHFVRNTELISVPNGVLKLLFQDTVKLAIGPKFTEISVSFQVAYIVHEYLHLILGHYTQRRPIEKVDAWLIAQDLAINPEMATAYGLPDDFAMPSDYKLPDRQSAEYYFERLKERKDIQYSGPRQQDTDPSVIRAFVRTNLRNFRGDGFPGESFAGSKALSRCLQNVCGANASIRWQQYVRSFVSRYSNGFKNRYDRYSRRLGEPFPARTTHRKKDLYILLDTSSSMTKLLPAVLTEIHVLESIANITIVQCDYQVHSKTAGIKNTDIKGFRNTDLNPGFKQAISDRASAVICFTDGKFNNTLISPLCPVLWVIVGGESFVPPFGQSILVG